MVALAVAHTGVFFAAGLPESVEDWFALLGRSRIFGTQARGRQRLPIPSKGGSLE